MIGRIGTIVDDASTFVVQVRNNNPVPRLHGRGARYRKRAAVGVQFAELGTWKL